MTSIPDRGDNTLRVNLSPDTDSTDPALACHIVSWQYEYLLQAKLLNYPDEPAPRGLEPVPEVAADLPTVSADGRVYTFTIRSGDDAYRLSNGETVTAAHFAAAINRVLHPKMQSPGAGFITDIVGADDVLNERAATASGVRVLAEDRLEIELTIARPDFPHRIAMPYFGAIPLDLPIVPEGVLTPPSAGPYFVASRDPGRQIVLERNPYYRHARPRHVDRLVYTVGVNPYTSVEQIEANIADYVPDGVPPDTEGPLGARYGVNKSQFFVATVLQCDYMALNTRRPLFGDARVRRAVNYAVDRPALLAARGEYAGVVTDHLLPPGMPGAPESCSYPLDGPDFERARAELPADWKEGHGVLYTWNTLAGPALGEMVKRSLEALGIHLEVKVLPETLMNKLAGRREEPFDAVLTGWTAEYPDPFPLMNGLLSGATIRDENNSNFSYFDDPAYNRRLAKVAELSGSARYEAYGQLDLDITRDAAPLIAYDNRTARNFLSSRVQGVFRHPVYGIHLGAIRIGAPS